MPSFFDREPGFITETISSGGEELKHQGRWIGLGFGIDQANEIASETMISSVA